MGKGKSLSMTEGYGERQAEPNPDLQNVFEAFVYQLSHTQALVSIALHEPGPALSLRVNKKRKPGGPCHQDTILYAQLIGRQPLRKLFFQLCAKNKRKVPLYCCKVERWGLRYMRMCYKGQ